MFNSALIRFKAMALKLKQIGKNPKNIWIFAFINMQFHILFKVELAQ